MQPATWWAAGDLRGDVGPAGRARSATVVLAPLECAGLDDGQCGRVRGDRAPLWPGRAAPDGGSGLSAGPHPGRLRATATGRAAWENRDRDLVISSVGFRCFSRAK